jgi:hypothetical protein
MSATSEILDAIEARIEALSTGRKKLAYSYDLEKNNSRDQASAYGYGSADADQETGPLKTVTLNHTFFVVLTEKFVNRRGEAKEVESLKKIYDDIETIYLDFCSSKLGVPNTVLVVESLSMDEPLKISENVVSVRANFVIKHRKRTT